MKRFLVILLLISTSLMTSSPILANADDEMKPHIIGGIIETESEIEELKKKIAEAQSTEKTLSGEIKAMDNKIRLTTLEITHTEEKIVQLGQEIEDLNGKIGRLEESLSHLSELLLNRIVTSYKMNRVSPLTILFSANNFSDFLNRAKYIQMAQTHDRQVMTEVQLTKVSFTEQKELREKKKIEQESLKTQLEKQKVELDTQKKAKEVILAQTKNNEATYQKLLQQALAEQRALEAALISGVQEGPVKTGDPIALVGNTGYPYCSTGAHLHFEVRTNNQWTNPAGYLKSKSVTDDQNGGGTTNVGSGDWEWPLGDTVRITQFYGQTPYSYVYKYSGGIHTGIDMVSSGSSVIKAPKDGTLYSSSQLCGSATIKIKYIDHGDGVISFYLHVQ